MSDAFSDLSSDETVVETATVESDTSNDDAVNSFNDALRSVIVDDGEKADSYRYEDPDGSGQADDTDPRGLFRDVTIDELRYYGRENHFGSTLVRKPIEDAFKHGYEIVVDDDDVTSSQDEGNVVSAVKQIGSFLDEYQDHYERARKKARLDGLCIIEHRYSDNVSSVGYPVGNDADHQGFQVWTLDNLSDDLTEAQVAQYFDGRDEYPNLDPEQIYVTESYDSGGVAILDDVSHPRYGEILGYGIQPRREARDPQTTFFLHIDRCQPLVNDPWVEGDLGNITTGKHVGESVLTPVLQPLKASHMEMWAIKNILYRYSAPLHAIEPPESWGQDEFDEARNKLEDISMSSDAVLPPGSELSVAEGVSEFDPEPTHDTIVKAICAGSVFTKSVLEGTQTGTVSGSETDVKGYFSEVHNIREQTIAKDFREAVEMVASNDQSTITRAAAFSDWHVDWNPLFKVSDVERAEGAISLITAATNGIKNYVLTPDEARSIVSEEWASFDIDVELDSLSEEQLDSLDRINIREAGQGPKNDEPRNNPRLQNGGGQPVGQTHESSQPNRTTTDSLTDDVSRFLLDQANYTSGEIVATPDGVGVVSGTLTEKIEDAPGTEKTIDATEQELNVVGFGGSFGIYPNESLDELDVSGPEELREISGTEEATTEGETVHYHDGSVSVSSENLPSGWDKYSLLSWWSGVGGEFSEAVSRLRDERDITKEQAQGTVAEFKQMILGTNEQIER